MRAVVDASFLLAVIPTEAGPSALAKTYPVLREHLDLVAPGLLALETGNAIHGRRRQRFGATLAERFALHRLLLEGIVRVPDDEAPRLAAGATLAERYGLTFYDATYLALAAEDDASVLLTQDGELLAAAKAELGPDRALGVREAIARFGT